LQHHQQPFSAEEHESVEGEFIATRASQDHPIFRDDNAKVYYFIKEAMRSTSYSSSIKPFSRVKRNRRGAHLAMLNSLQERTRGSQRSERNKQT